ncbi:MAG: transposase, partial [Coleofasciculus sp. C2-GNP5-27]
MKRSKDRFKLNYQYRIVPDKHQNYQLNKWLYKLCRIHNLMLEERFKWWECNRSPVNACPIFVTHLPELKDQPTYYSQKRATHCSRESYKDYKSARERKLAKKISKHHQKLQRKRKQFHYESATRLVSRNEKVFFVENIKPGNLSRKNKPKQDENGKYLPNGQSAKSGLNKSINDAGWGQFLSILAYKAAKAGKSVVKVKPHDTSQVCSCCNRYQKKDLSVRIHECLCGLIMDRDWNAAINIKK